MGSGTVQLLDSGDEAGTAPADRRFRPDVEGLRAVSILLVVLYHAGVPRLTGGFVGVDIFFVISGFVITGLLLRERNGTGGTSILNFYARRVRRIIPAATVTILVTVSFAYLFLGAASGGSTANDGRWAAVFLSNFHFEAVGTNYFTASLPPSPLQNFWSLSVEEQFYVVYPTLFLTVASLKSRISLRTRLTVVLGVAIVASYWWSVVQTGSDPSSAYFSPFTRAWELALGALIAVNTPWLKKFPSRVAALLSWIGIASVLTAAFAFGPNTPYPGSLVAIPVIGAGLIIAGGTAVPRIGAESVLRLQPFQWLGQRSYSLYLWHWPILIIAAERVGKYSLSVGDNLLLLLVALAIAAFSYAVIETPIRHWRLPSKQSVGAGIAVVVATVLALTAVISGEAVAVGGYNVKPANDAQAVLQEVAAARHIVSLPATLVPPVSAASADQGRTSSNSGCIPSETSTTAAICVLGDPKGHRLMVLYGDSHALMWRPAFNAIAKRAHWRLVILAKPSCPAALVSVEGPAKLDVTGRFTECDQWHQWAVNWINENKPKMVVASQLVTYAVPRGSPKYGSEITPSTWRSGLESFFREITVPNVRKVMLGSTPESGRFVPQCLIAHPHNVEACSVPRGLAANPSDQEAEIKASAASHAKFINLLPWFCSATCTAVIGRYDVYRDQTHITAVYAEYLELVLNKALKLN